MASSSSDFVNQLAKKPLGHKLGILAGVLAALGLLYWQFFYSDLKDKEASAESSKARMLKQAKEYDDQLDEMKELNAKLDQLRAIIDANKQALPTEAELPAFFDHIQKKAGEAGVSIKSWDRKDEVGVEDFMKVPVEISIEGTYYQIVKYFALLGPMSKGAGDEALVPEDEGEGEGELEKPEAERLVSIENLQISNGEFRNDEVILTARFFASTFRQAGDPAPAAPPTKKKDAAKGKSGAAKGDAAAKSKNAKDHAKNKGEAAKDTRENKVDEAAKKK